MNYNRKKEKKKRFQQPLTSFNNTDKCRTRNTKPASHKRLKKYGLAQVKFDIY